MTSLKYGLIQTSYFLNLHLKDWLAKLGCFLHLYFDDYLQKFLVLTLFLEIRADRLFVYNLYFASGFEVHVAIGLMVVWLFRFE